jgi:membrane-associated protease RseP (regulator of RpoE activity)
MSPIDPVLQRLKEEEEIAIRWGHGEIEEDGSTLKLLDPKTATLLDPKRHYNNRSGWVQLAVVLAGPVASFALAIALWVGLAVLEYQSPTIFFSQGEIVAVLSDSELGKQGVKYQDLVVVESRQASLHEWKPTVNDTPYAYIVRRESKTIVDVNPGVPLIEKGAVALMKYKGSRCTNGVAVTKEWSVLDRAVAIVVKCVVPLTVENGVRDPFGFGYVAANFGSSWRLGLFSIAIMTLCIGVLNLVPILPLDGGRALVAVMGVMGRPVSQRVVLLLSVLGFYVLAGGLIYSIVKAVVR